MSEQEPWTPGKWILGDEKDGLPAYVRWPVTNGRLRFNLFSSEEQEALRDYLATLTAENAAQAERIETYALDLRSFRYYLSHGGLYLQPETLAHLEASVDRMLQALATKGQEALTQESKEQSNG